MKYRMDVDETFKLNNIPEHLKKTSEPIDFVYLFLDETYWEYLAEQTNLYAQQSIIEMQNKGKLKPFSRVKAWKNTNSQEIKIYSALVLWTGLISNIDLKGKIFIISDNWSKDKLHETNFKEYIKLYRFQLLHRFFHLANNLDDKKTDDLFKIRPVLDLMNSNWSKYNNADQILSVDEAIIKYNGRIKFRQYIMNKPVKWGIKAFLICNSLDRYCHGLEIYYGKNMMFTEGFSKTESVVIRLAEKYVNSYRVLLMDS